MTDLLYLKGFDVETCSAKVREVTDSEDGRKAVILDTTCFYPRGGGQDWDTGRISSNNAEFLVEEVRMDEDGNVHHIGKFSKGSFQAKDKVHGVVDHERRSINTRLHSAGHVIDMAVAEVKPDWVAGKGQHYPHLSAIEYIGVWDPEQAEKLKAEIESSANRLSQTDIENRLEFMDREEMTKVCRHIPDNIPTNKPTRVIIYGQNFGVPCGGTHVKKLQDIGKIIISKLKQKKGVIRISYRVEGIN